MESALGTTEIAPLRREIVAQLLADRAGSGLDEPNGCRRQSPRWPFPGTVELWLPSEQGGEQYELATSVNLSVDGLALQFDEPLDAGLNVGIAFHEPEVSLHGRAVVRHCRRIDDDRYFIGVQFQFPEDGSQRQTHRMQK